MAPVGKKGSDNERNRGLIGSSESVSGQARVRGAGSRVVASIPEGWKRVSVPAGVPRTARSCCRAIGYS